MLPVLQQTENGSRPWAARIFTSSSVSASRPMQVAMPILRQPMIFASAIVSSTRVQRAVTVPLPGVFS